MRKRILVPRVEWKFIDSNRCKIQSMKLEFRITMTTRFYLPRGVYEIVVPFRNRTEPTRCGGLYSSKNSAGDLDPTQPPRVILATTRDFGGHQIFIRGSGGAKIRK